MTDSMDPFTFYSRSSQGLVNCSSLLLNRVSILVRTEARCGHGQMHLDTGKEGFLLSDLKRTRAEMVCSETYKAFR